MPSPTLADVDGAIGIWTVEDDEQAATDTNVRKPSLRPEAAADSKVDLYAVTSTLTFGNLGARAFPEWVAATTDTGFAAHARVAEQKLLQQISALSTSVTGDSTSPDLGATRVLLPYLDRAASAMRYRMRTGSQATLQLMLPAWTRGILREDLAMQQPGDAREGVTDAELTAYLTSRYLAVSWLLDGEDASQRFDLQAANGSATAWPTAVIAYLFPAGAFQFLDGGTLDLGLVRDSALNAANDYQLFFETFEGVVHRGGEALRLNVPVTPSGVARAAK